MSRESKKAASRAIVLVLLGLLAFYGATRWLLVLIPLALMMGEWRDLRRDRA